MPLSLVCSLLYRCNLKRAEGEVDEVPGIAAAALHTFIYQHSEYYFMDSQQGDQHQCCSGQTEDMNRKSIEWCIIAECILAHEPKSKGQNKGGRRVCKCMREPPYCGDIYGGVKKPEFMGVI